MILADTSALVTLASIDILSIVLQEYDVHTTETVRQELEETSRYNDVHGDAAHHVLDHVDNITVHQPVERRLQSSRIDQGEASCALLSRELDADFLITDDFRALPEIQPIADAKVAISPILLKALVKRGVLNRDEALDKLDQIADNRDWLGAPIYRRAVQLFEEDTDQ